MKNQVLSIEQMRHLKELGVDTSKASMYWARKSHGSRIDDESKGKWFVSLHKEFMTCGFTAFEFIPAFTLQDIIELLPKRLETKDKKEGELLMFYDSYMKTGWNVRYTDYFDDIIQDFKLIDALYKLLCWVAENGYLKGGEK